MFSIARTIGIAAMTLGGASAADFMPLMEVAKATWPAKTHLAVVANYHRSAAQVQELADAAGDGMRITVVDCPDNLKLNLAHRVLLGKVKPDLLILLPDDPLIHDGGFDATWLVGQASVHGVPTLATTPVAIKQGAILAIGPETGMELLLTHRLQGTVDVILPTKGSYLGKTSRLTLPHGSAPIQVLGGL